MLAGRLRHVIDIEEISSSKDAHGQPVQVWTKIADRRAAIKQVSSSESFKAGAENYSGLVEIKVRYDSVTKSITKKNRIVHEGVNYDIQSIDNIRMLNRDLIFICEARNGI